MPINCAAKSLYSLLTVCHQQKKINKSYSHLFFALSRFFFRVMQRKWGRGSPSIYPVVLLLVVRKGKHPKLSLLRQVNTSKEELANHLKRCISSTGIIHSYAFSSFRNQKQIPITLNYINSFYSTDVVWLDHRIKDTEPQWWREEWHHSLGIVARTFTYTVNLM